MDDALTYLPSSLDLAGCGQCQTRFDAPTVQQDRARSAGARFAPEFRARQGKRAAQRFEDPRIKERVLPIWFDHFASHSPEVWQDHDVPSFLLP